MSDPMRQRGISDRMRRRIFAALKEAGILDEDARHDIQEAVTGTTSLREFTEADARQLLEHLTTQKHSPQRRLSACDAQAGKGREEKKRRRKYTRPDGVLVMYPQPSASEKQIRYAYMLMHEISKAEKDCIRLGLISAPANVTGDTPAGKRLDGWATALTNGEARGISQLMGEEISRLHTQLRNRNQWLGKKLAEYKPSNHHDTRKAKP